LEPPNKRRLDVPLANHGTRGVGRYCVGKIGWRHGWQMGLARGLLRLGSGGEIGRWGGG
jgi:hypothetical protein